MLQSYFLYNCSRVRNVFIILFVLNYMVKLCRLVYAILDTALLNGDLKTNPSPKHISGQRFSICQWNLNSISVHNYTKISLLNAYVLVQNVDIIGLSGTYLNSETIY